MLKVELLCWELVKPKNVEVIEIKKVVQIEWMAGKQALANQEKFLAKPFFIGPSLSYIRAPGELRDVGICLLE